MSSSQPPPLNLVLDIDGTLIADISLFTVSYNIIKDIPRNTKLMNRLKSAIVAALKNGLMRPHLPQFIRYAKRSYDIKFFIYTASTYDWAHFLIPCIEKALGITFERPLYTRDDCTTNGMLKDLSFVSKSVGNDTTPIIMIDNNKTLFKKQDKKRLIKCPTYNFKYYFNPISIFTYSELVSHFCYIKTVLKTHNIRVSANDPVELYRYCQAVTIEYFIKSPDSTISDTFFNQKSISKKLLKMLK